MQLCVIGVLEMKSTKKHEKANMVCNVWPTLLKNDADRDLKGCANVCEF